MMEAQERGYQKALWNLWQEQLAEEFESSSRVKKVRRR
jgi:hypothetical protein